jgi:glycosyltransferase involved in cell wall biosynthesis
VHCLSDRGRIAEELAREGFTVHLHGPAAPLTLMRKLYRAFATEKPHVVHLHNVGATLVGAAPARMAGVKCAISTRHGLVPRPYSWRREVQFSLAARFCNFVVAVCKTAEGNLAGAPLAARRKIVTVLNGAVAPPLDGTGGPEERQPGFTLVTVGRLVPEKDHECLLRAVALARPSLPDLRVWIIGDGVLANYLETLRNELGLGECVHFFGDRRDVGSFLARSDVFVLSSRTEGLPVSLLEALAAGLPMIVTDVGGMSEVVKPSGAGAIVAPSDPQALAAAITRLAQSRELLEEMGRKGRSYYEEHFTPERMADDYARLYARCNGNA